MLTGVRDVDLTILSHINDEDLLSFCRSRGPGDDLCNNENFWRNRFAANFGEFIMKYKPANMTWKRFYLKVIHDLNMDGQTAKNVFNDSNRGMIVIWEDANVDSRFIKYCANIKGTRGFILIVNSSIRNNIIAFGAATCAICTKFLNMYVELPPRGWRFGNNLNEVIDCMFDIQNIESKLDGRLFSVEVKYPIVKGKCGHVYHNGCINHWRRKRDICPLDNNFWEPISMDSYISGHFEKL